MPLSSHFWKQINEDLQINIEGKGKLLSHHFAIGKWEYMDIIVPFYHTILINLKSQLVSCDL